MNFGLKTLAIASVAMFIGSTVYAAGDAAKGEQVFKKCAACHKVGPGAKNAFGPVLNGVVGRKAGSEAGYRYSKSMEAARAAGLVWSEKTIPEFIENPSKFLKTYLKDNSARSKMPFKLRNATQREDVAAYLATQSASN